MKKCYKCKHYKQFTLMCDQQIGSNKEPKYICSKCLKKKIEEEK